MKHNMPTIEELLAHYTRLAGTPGWKQYCWHRVNELAAQNKEYAELPALLTQAMASVAAVRPHALGAKG